MNKTESVLENQESAYFRGLCRIDCYGPDCVLKWTKTNHNIITNVGLNHILDVVLHGDTPVSPWYVGIKNAGSVAASDTLATHAGWTENSNYTGNRQEYNEAAASGQSTTNSANKASFPITSDSQTIAGAFLASAATGTSGTLLCVADFASSKAADNGDTLEVTYTVSAADDGA